MSVKSDAGRSGADEDATTAGSGTVELSKATTGRGKAGCDKAGGGKAGGGKAGKGKAGRGAGRRAGSDSTVVIRKIAAVVAVLALLAAIGAVAYYGFRAYEVYAVESPTQQARDDATGAAEQAMLNVTTIDPKNMNTFNQRLESSFAGDALDQVRQQVVSTLDPQLQQAGSSVGSTTSRVVRSAPTEVDADGGTAQVLIYLAVTGKTPGQASETPSTMGFLVGMKKFDDTWKAVKVSPLDGISYAGDSSTSAAPTTQAPAGGN